MAETTTTTTSDYSWVGDVWDWISDNAGDIVDVAGDVASWYASEQQQEAVENIAKRQAGEIATVAKENAALLRYDATIAEEEAKRTRVAADYAYWQNNRAVDRTIASQTAEYGKAGVAVSEGSPLDVALQTASEGQREGRVVMHNGLTAAARSKEAGDRLRKGAAQTINQANRQIDILYDAMSDQLTALEYQQWAAGASSLFDTGFRNDWWR